MSPVVVGADDSEESLRAVEWAAGEAARRGRPLRIVHAFVWPLLGAPRGPAPGAPPEGGLQHAAERVLAAALARARTVAPGVQATTELPETEPITTLLHHSRHADLLVVGSRGLGEVGGLLLGSVGARLATESACPLVVVRGPVTSEGPVVVGMSAGDDREEALLAFAFAHAARTTNALIVAHVGTEANAAPLPEPVLAAWQERFPTVTIDRETLTGRPDQALTHAASRAGLLVVGSHHRHELGALMHGSVSQAVLHHATCPVAIIQVHA